MKRTLLLTPRLRFVPHQYFHQVVHKLSDLGQRLAAALVPAQEPRVWQTKRNGHITWHGYDPATGTSVIRHSEAEMRVWIEERYYQ